MSIKEWIRRDFNEITDPSYKNELKANRFLGITLFIVGVISLICVILQAADVFILDKDLEIYAFYSCNFVVSMIGFLISYLSKDGNHWVKYFLIVELTLIAITLDMFLANYASLFLAVPFICVARYANKRMSANIWFAVLFFILLNGFIAYFTNVELDLNIVSPKDAMEEIIHPGSISYWSFTKGNLLYIVIPKFMAAAILGLLCLLNARNIYKYAQDEIAFLKKEERIKSELALARKIQENMLPRVFPPFPNIKNFNIYANMISAKEVGGDMYDFFLIDDQHLAMVVADVSGKGIPAALFMGMTKTLIKNAFEENESLDVVIAHVNDMLSRENPVNLFVTVWIGVLDLYSGELTYVNAGHNYPFLYKNKKLIMLTDKSGMALGISLNKLYKQYKVKLNPDDRLFLYTDGVTEATSVKNELYGEKRLKNYLIENMNLDDSSIVNNLLVDLNKFQEGREQFDDITMLSLTFKSFIDKKNARKDFIAVVENFSLVSEFIEETLSNFGISFKYINQMNIAVEEIFTNIAKYGYAGLKNGKATVDITYMNGVLTVTTFDNSPMFDPFGRKDPDITLTAEDRPIGGLGLLMVKRLMDDVSYKYENETNIIKLIKKVE